MTTDPLTTDPLTTWPGIEATTAEVFSPLRLVPSDDHRPAVAADAGDQGEPWYLGPGGTMAHRPAAGQLPAQRSGGLPAPSAAVCGIFLTKLIAGPDVPRCELCTALSESARKPRNPDVKNPEQCGGGDAMA